MSKTVNLNWQTNESVDLNIDKLRLATQRNIKKTALWILGDG
jgi:hypothetical protein